MDDDDRLVAARDERGRTGSGLVDRELERLVRRRTSRSGGTGRASAGPPGRRHRRAETAPSPDTNRRAGSTPAIPRAPNRLTIARLTNPLPWMSIARSNCRSWSSSEEPRDRGQFRIELGQTREPREVDELVDIAVEPLDERPSRRAGRRELMRASGTFARIARSAGTAHSRSPNPGRARRTMIDRRPRSDTPRRARPEMSTSAFAGQRLGSRTLNVFGFVPEGTRPAVPLQSSCAAISVRARDAHGYSRWPAIRAGRGPAIPSSPCLTTHLATLPAGGARA